MHTKLQEIYLFYRKARYIWFFSRKIMGLLRLTFRNVAPLIEWGPFRSKPVQLFTFLCLRCWPLILFKKLVRTGAGATTHPVVMNLTSMVWRKIWQSDLFVILCFSGFSSKISEYFLEKFGDGIHFKLGCNIRFTLLETYILRKLPWKTF